MLTIKLMRRENGVSSTTIRESEHVEVVELTKNEMSEVRTDTEIFTIANPNRVKPYLSNYFSSVFVENAAGSTTHSVKFN